VLDWTKQGNVGDVTRSVGETSQPVNDYGTPQTTPQPAMRNSGGFDDMANHRNSTSKTSK
jgi:hypothetical protein